MISPKPFYGNAAKLLLFLFFKCTKLDVMFFTATKNIRLFYIRIFKVKVLKYLFSNSSLFTNIYTVTSYSQMAISSYNIVIKYFYSVCMCICMPIYTYTLLYLYNITGPQNQ